MADRTVHARRENGDEIVRYDRAGKWWLEPGKGVSFRRRRLALREAVALAAEPGARVFYDRPGGSMFDAAVSRERTRA